MQRRARRSAGRKTQAAAVRAFSLMEVLVAILILGIGLMMVAAVFPVGASWTRRSATESVAQSVACNALAVIRRRYGEGGDGADALSSFASTSVEPLPGVDAIPLAQRACRFGADATSAIQASDVAGCAYFWTAVARMSPLQPAEGRSLDVYILVFHKASAEQQFSGAARIAAGEFPGMQVDGAGVPRAIVIPSTASAEFPRPGEYGIGQNSGTVFRVSVDPRGRPTMTPPLNPATDANLWVAPAADGTAASPLVYIYQTTLSF